jgi:hypothetical protein
VKRLPGAAVPEGVGRGTEAAARGLDGEHRTESHRIAGERIGEAGELGIRERQGGR